MPVAVVMKFKDATLQQYDQIREKLGMAPGGETPAGALFHWAAMTDNGLRIVDVWETKEQFESFSQEKIGPYSAEVGIEETPEMSFYDVHNYLAAH